MNIVKRFGSTKRTECLEQASADSTVNTSLSVKTDNAADSLVEAKIKAASLKIGSSSQDISMIQRTGETTMFSEKYISEIKNFKKNMGLDACSENDKIELLDEIAKYFIIESSLVKGNCLFCDKCKKWYNKNEFASKTKIKMIKNVLTHVDSGYGDDDLYGDVTYLIYYHECPLCHEEIEDRKTTLKVENER